MRAFVETTLANNQTRGDEAVHEAKIDSCPSPVCLDDRG